MKIFEGDDYAPVSIIKLLKQRIPKKLGFPKESHAGRGKGCISVLARGDSCLLARELKYCRQVFKHPGWKELGPTP